MVMICIGQVAGYLVKSIQGDNQLQYNHKFSGLLKQTLIFSEQAFKNGWCLIFDLYIYLY